LLYCELNSYTKGRLTSDERIEAVVGRLYVKNLGIIVIFTPYSKSEYLKLLSHAKNYLVDLNMISGKY
jgi:hypothetical protein